MVNDYPKLFEPIEISGLRLRNRVVKAPMATNYATPDGFVTPEMIAYYRERARGGPGLVIVEFASIDDVAGKSWHRQLGAESDEKVEGLGRLADGIRSGDAASALQICHCGSQRLLPGGPPRVPSASAAPTDREVREVDEKEIAQIAAAFGDAAGRAQQAGFDMVEVHAAHGYLIMGFLSPETNRRTDAFGGGLEGRLRFPRMVMEAVRNAVGETFPVCVRMNGSEMYRGGMGVREGCQTARAFIEAGADLLHVSAGTYGTRHLRSTPMYGKRGNLVPLSAAIKKVSSVPVIASGGLADPGRLEAILREGRADLVSMARQLHAEPRWAEKVREGRLDDIRPCIRCNAGCLGSGLAGERVLCDVNPAAGFEADFETRPAARAKRVAVVGGRSGGDGGGARSGDARSRCPAFEAQDQLGGALIPATRPDFKADLRAFLEFQVRQVRKLPVEIRLGARVDAGMVEAMGAEEVVLATGAVFRTPAEISGSDDPKVMMADRALLDSDRVGKRVVVVGGGVTGCETAWRLARLGRRVTLFEMREDLAPDMEGMHRPVLMKGFEETGVAWRTRARVTAVAEDGTVSYRIHGVSTEEPADTVILAVGVEPERGLVDALAGLDIPVHEIGDCARPGRVLWAMHDGARVGRSI